MRRTAKMSAVEASAIPFSSLAETPPAVTPNVSSPTKSSRRTRSKSSESKGTVMVSLPADGSTYLDSSFVRDVANTLLLLADC